MGFHGKGIENHVPGNRLPLFAEEGIYVCKILKAHWFVGRKSRDDTFVAELLVLDASDPASVGRKFSYIKVENQFPEYYLAAVRGFVAAALNIPIEDVDADVATEAVNERDESPGLCTGEKIIVEVTENQDKPQFPHIMFSPVEEDG